MKTGKGATVDRLQSMISRLLKINCENVKIIKKQEKIIKKLTEMLQNAAKDNNDCSECRYDRLKPCYDSDDYFYCEPCPEDCRCRNCVGACNWEPDLDMEDDTE